MTDSQDTLLFWASLDALNLDHLQRLRSHFGSLALARAHVSLNELLKAGFSPRSATSLVKKIEALSFETIRRMFDSSEAKLLFYEDEMFPKALQVISDPPLFLFVKGELLEIDTFALAVVGTRKPSPNGVQAVEHFVPPIVQTGMTIVSGMANGIDSLAHKTTIDAGGRTIAVWGTGIDRIYPPTNKSLSEAIMYSGAIVSEFPLGVGPETYNFPRRNRILSGLSKGVLVIEGEEKSGSLITARTALDQNKEVFAVPGAPFAPLSRGPNKLIQSGEAKLVLEAGDVLEEFGVRKEESFVPAQVHFENKLEKDIWNTLSTGEMSFDTLVHEVGVGASELSPVLMMLALRGVVCEVGYGVWRRKL